MRLLSSSRRLIGIAFGIALGIALGIVILAFIVMKWIDMNNSYARNAVDKIRSGSQRGIEFGMGIGYQGMGKKAGYWSASIELDDIVRIGRPTVPYLLPLLRSSDAEERTRAYIALERIRHPQLGPLIVTVDDEEYMSLFDPLEQDSSKREAAVVEWESWWAGLNR